MPVIFGHGSRKIAYQIWLRVFKFSAIVYTKGSAYLSQKPTFNLAANISIWLKQTSIVIGCKNFDQACQLTL